MADAMVTGGAEAAITGLTVAGFANMKALSTRNDSPGDGQPALRPGSRRLRAGRRRRMVVLGEPGARRSSGAPDSGRGDRLRRQRRRLPHHLTRAENGEGAAAGHACLPRDGNIDLKDVDYINAHGTSTPQGDIAETEAVKAVFGEHARKLVFGSTKSMTGHLLGAAGGLEFGVSLLSATCGVIPPTINQFTPDPECDLDSAPNRKVERKVEIATSNSFGFGGHNVTLAVRAWEA